MPLDLIEFPADDLARARRFWEALLDVSLDERKESEGEGLQTHDTHPSLGLHERGRGPGDRFASPTSPAPSSASSNWAEASSTRASAGRSAVTPRAVRPFSRLKRSGRRANPFVVQSDCALESDGMEDERRTP